MLDLAEHIRPVALVSLFGERDSELYNDSYGTVERHEYRGDASLRVFDVQDIKLVVGMIPDDDELPDEDPMTDYAHFHVGRHYFVLEKLRIQLGVEEADPEMGVDDDSN